MRHPHRTTKNCCVDLLAYSSKYHLIALVRGPKWSVSQVYFDCRAPPKVCTHGKPPETMRYRPLEGAHRVAVGHRSEIKKKNSRIRCITTSFVRVSLDLQVLTSFFQGHECELKLVVTA